MKKALIPIIIFGMTLNIFAATAGTYKGTTENGKACSIKISSPEAGDYANIIMHAKIGGWGIPFFLGGMRTKNYVFKMVQYESNDRIVSMASKGDPEIEIYEDRSGDITDYKFIKGGLTGGARATVMCRNLSND